MDSSQGNDAALATQGIRTPDAATAAAIAPDAVAPALETPDITKAQLVGGIPVITKLLTAFVGVSLTAAQTEALTLAAGSGVALFIADAAIRFGRAHKL